VYTLTACLHQVLMLALASLPADYWLKLLASVLSYFISEKSSHCGRYGRGMKCPSTNGSGCFTG